MSWLSVLGSPKYKTFEDPLTSMTMIKEHFNDMYGPACNELLMDIPLGMVFEESPVICGHWCFVDNIAKEDVYSISVEMGLVHTVREVEKGETLQEEEKRKTCPQDRLQVVERLLDDPDISNKKRKKLEREQRGLVSKLRDHLD